MPSKPPIASLNYSMDKLPAPWRALVICLALALGAGYCSAVVNLYSQNEFADGSPGLTPNDLLVKFHGGYVAPSADMQAQSSMLEKSDTEMRDHFSSDRNYEVLRNWLLAGAPAGDFDRGAEPTPKQVLESDCTVCHTADAGDGLALTAPFGPDEETASYAMVSKFTATAEAGGPPRWRGPVNWRKLALVTHIHVLAVPLFVVLLASLFLWTKWPRVDSRHARTIRLLIGVAPMLCFFGDVACWWLARLPFVGAAFAYCIAVCGMGFGLSFVLQWAVVMGTLCQVRRLRSATIVPRVRPAVRAISDCPLRPSCVTPSAVLTTRRDCPRPAACANPDRSRRVMAAACANGQEKRSAVCV